jgi:hypothetical protein
MSPAGGGSRGLVFKADPVLWTRSIAQAADAIHGCPLTVFQSEVVVHRMPELLLAAQIVLSCLNRGVSKQKLNLLKFPTRHVA